MSIVPVGEPVSSPTLSVVTADSDRIVRVGEMSDHHGSTFPLTFPCRRRSTVEVVSNQKTSAVAPLAAGAAMSGVCCGLPLLASAGVLGAVAGVGLGSWLVGALAAVVVAIGVVRWRRTCDSWPAPGPVDHESPPRQHGVLSPTRPYRNEEESP